MKTSLLGYMVCPQCHGTIVCLNPTTEKGEIQTATLQCTKCKEEYLVKNFIPRMLPKKQVPEKHATAKAFGWAWNKFTKIHDLENDKEQFLDWVHPLPRTTFEGKVVLDAGCGIGRFAEVVDSFGAKAVLAVDVSDAVETAYNNTKHLPHVYVVQADIYALPFRKVDLAYSIGVLHHLPDPAKGFQALLPHIQPGGWISIWVYGLENNEWIVRWINPIRKNVTSKLPYSLLYGICFCMAIFLYPILRLLYKSDTAVGWRSKLTYANYLQWLAKYNFTQTHQVLFDHLSAPTSFYLGRGEIERWVREAGLSNVHISWRNKNGWRANGKLQGHSLKHNAMTDTGT